MIRALMVRMVLTCAVGGVALAASSLLAAPALVQAPAESGPTTGDRATSAAPEAARVTRLLATHGCWSGEAPAGAPEPGYAVVTSPGGRARLVEASVGFGIWLEGEPGVLHGFCP